jgi:MFS family permease
LRRARPTRCMWAAVSVRDAPASPPQRAWTHSAEQRCQRPVAALLPSPGGPIEAEFLTPLRRNRSFLLLWSGQSVSLIGSQVTVVARPLTAALTLGASPWEMGVLAACSRFPYLLFGLPAGVWVDRLPRRPLLIACAAAQTVTLGLIPAAAALGLLSLPLLLAAAFVAGVLAVFADIAGLALVPMVVPRSQFIGGQSALETSQSISQIAGPALSGWLVQALTAPLAILADALSFLISVGTIACVKVRERPVREPDGSGMARQIAAGARAVFGHRVLRYVTLCTTTHIFFYSAFTAVFVLYLARGLGMAPSVLGLTLSAGALGGLIGSMAAARISRRIGLGRALTMAIIVAGLGSSLAAIAHGSSGVSVIEIAGSQVLMWCALQIYNVLQVPVRYALTPKAMHGRVNATIRTTVWGTASLGALAGGLIGDVTGLRATLIVAGAGASLASLWLILTRVTAVHNLDSAALLDHTNI